MENNKLKQIKDKCELFNQFLIDRTGMPAQLFKETNKLLEKAYKEQDSKVLRAADNDINEQIKHMPILLALELKSILKEKLNIDFEIVDKLQIKAIEKVVKRGKINKPEEYELLLNRVEEIYTDLSLKDEVKQLNELLAAYVKK
ncbi:MAG: hypothetical protein V4620_00560 [Bacteroidota bacterium]